MTELEYWTQQASQGRISRREFMGRAAALGVAAATATSILSRAGVAATPKRGGSAKFGLAHGSTSDSGNPAGFPDTATQIPFWGTMSNSLTIVDVKGDVKPDLAASFEPSNGAAKWIFRLTKGATFHNGKDVTADDVIASFRHHMGKDSKSAVKTVLAPIKDIKADDKLTVIFELEGGNADFPYIASDYHIPIMPAKDGAADWQSNVRTGPFIFDSWEPGVRAKLKRNPNYHETAVYSESTAKSRPPAARPDRVNCDRLPTVFGTDHTAFSFTRRIETSPLTCTRSAMTLARNPSWSPSGSRGAAALGEARFNGWRNWSPTAPSIY